MTPSPDDESTEALQAESGERYERGERIATGGMGEVWRARDTVLGREVAVKILKREYAEDPTFRARFEAEARHAAGLHHPGIASVFDYGLLREGNTPYLVMELVHGRPLLDLIVGQPFDPEQARLLALQTAEALGNAHAAGVVHRDVKPGNLLVTPEGRVKITDFGIARATGSVAFTQTGQIVGTPQYLSPEQARGESATAASDVYALGIVMFEMLAGRRPFVADTPIATALAQIQQDVPPLPDSVPAGLAQIVGHALAKDPHERYTDGAELAAALRGAAEEGAPVPVPSGAGGATSVLPAGAAVGAAGAAGGSSLGGPVAASAATGTGRDPATDPAMDPAMDPADPAFGGAVGDRGRSRWPLYAAALVALVVLAGLLLTRPWADDATSTDPGDNGSPTSSAVRVRAADYLGRPVEEVVSELRAEGLETTVESKPNPRGRPAATVADLSPTGLVQEGTRITVVAWAEPAADTPEDRGGSQGDDEGEEPPEEEPKDEPAPADPEPTESDPGEDTEQGGATKAPKAPKATKAPKAPKADKPAKADKPGQANKPADAPSAGAPTQSGS